MTTLELSLTTDDLRRAAEAVAVEKLLTSGDEKEAELETANPTFFQNF